MASDTEKTQHLKKEENQLMKQIGAGSGMSQRLINLICIATILTALFLPALVVRTLRKPTTVAIQDAVATMTAGNHEILERIDRGLEQNSAILERLETQSAETATPAR